MKNIIMTTKCNCCANSTKVYTIYGLLKKAYETIDNDDRTKRY